jgi:SAM-dependent methyltransferase
MRKIDYSHSINRHTLAGPRAALPVILEMTKARSILDVGCGRGTWLKTALDLGISDVLGVDGISIKPDELLIPRTDFKVLNLTQPWQLGRKYDLAFCLEVAEHLEEQYAPTLIESLTAHADSVVFSAACPGQDGQHHVNCQWPEYWQKLFNDRGFTCSDELRWRLWQDDRIEPWYRQNIFVAHRAGGGSAGKEPRIQPVIHPDVIKEKLLVDDFSQYANFIRDGGMPMKWYLKLPLSVLCGRLRRKLNAGKSG